ncbi:MAG: hypothetical protein AAB347_09395 [Bacteroidota bacterium]
MKTKAIYIQVLQPFKEEYYTKSLVKIKKGNAIYHNICTAVYNKKFMPDHLFQHSNLFSLRYGYDMTVNYGRKKEVNELIFLGTKLKQLP